MGQPRRAFITGISGQDGSYLAEHLLGAGYEVHGLVRPPERRPLATLAGIRGQLHLWPGDVADTERIHRLLKLLQPDEIYHLAAVTYLNDTWKNPTHCFDVNARAVVGLLDAARQGCPKARFFQAGTSELFGQPETSPQDEKTPFRPRSPYGLAKQAAHHAVQFYREKHGLFAVNGIMFNHESPRRPTQFVTRKITHAAARIRHGLQRELRLGNLDACRDWGFAADYVRAMHAMLQLDQPQDLVIGTGELHTVQSLVETAFGVAGLEWQRYVVVDPAFCRPPEAVPLRANSTLARQTLGWTPSLTFEQLIEMMTTADLQQIASGEAQARAA